ncbi:SWI/SNF-related matrix-associated actin-dependent regulator of chromatin subfamily A containing DEAD/H box 1B-like [Aphidius gifuensis]|uniref:SWI/SNF-related matrix-associated actin-dependent regulator of chromatin subfamily A containing DEAD/H box 1B-like n=1 Tax=Aphidius gifuensis TaxID=684658 RepID=UPI001CDD541A|nr:SWI/SNF-related matrix-associated actin-dependent regulator of chromatin subfamily A containing DEAD/H box 1B-like [Aphidius gifuensis]
MVNFCGEVLEKKLHNAESGSLKSDAFNQVQGDGKSCKMIKLVLMLAGVIGVIGAIGFFYVAYEYSRMPAENTTAYVELNIENTKLERKTRSVQAYLNDDVISNTTNDVETTTTGELFEPEPKGMNLYTEKQKNEIRKFTFPNVLWSAVRRKYRNETSLSLKLREYVEQQNFIFKRYYVEVENITTSYEYNTRTHPIKIPRPSTMKVTIDYEPELKFLGSLLFSDLSGILVGEIKSIQQKIIGIYSSLLNNMNHLESGKPLLILTFKSNINDWLYYFRSVSTANITEYNNDMTNQLLSNNCTYDSACGDIYNTQAIVMTYEDMKVAYEKRSLFEKLNFKVVVYDLGNIYETEENLKSAYLTLNQLPNTKNKIILLNTFDNHQVYLYKYIYMSMWSSVYKKNLSIYEKYMENCQRKCYTEKYYKFNKSSWCTEFDVQQTEKEMKILKSFTFKTDPIIYEQNYPIHDERAVYCKLTPNQKQHYQILEKSIDMDISKKVFNFTKAIKTTKVLRALVNHVLQTRNYWHDELIEYAISQVEINNMVKHSRTKQLRSVDYASMSDMEINRVFTPYHYLKTLTHRRHKVAIFSERSDIFIIERYLSLKHYQFLKVDNETASDKQMAILNQFNNNTSTSIIIVPFVDVCKEFILNLSSVDTVIMFSVTFQDNYLKTINECYHLGEKKPVIVERLISEDTIEQYIYQTKPKDLQDFQDKVFATAG